MKYSFSLKSFIQRKSFSLSAQEKFKNVFLLSITSATFDLISCKVGLFLGFYVISTIEGYLMLNLHIYISKINLNRESEISY